MVDAYLIDHDGTLAQVYKIVSGPAPRYIFVPVPNPPSVVKWNHENPTNPRCTGGKKEYRLIGQTCNGDFFYEEVFTKTA